MQFKKRRRVKIIKRLPCMQNINKQDVLLRMRQKDRIGGNYLLIEKIKKDVDVYYLLRALFLRFHLEITNGSSVKDVHDSVLFFKTIYFLDEILIKQTALTQDEMEEYCLISFLIQWKLERVARHPFLNELAKFLIEYRDGRSSKITFLKHHLRKMEMKVMQVMQYDLYVVTPFDFIKTFMCIPGCIYLDDSEYLFEKMACDTLQDVVESGRYNLRKYKAETVACFIIWLVKEKDFGHFQQFNTDEVKVLIKDITI